MDESAPDGDRNNTGLAATDGSDSAGSPERRSLSEISNALVQVYKDQFGRGPTKVRTHYAGPDTLVCLLKQSFTPAELNLQAMGEHQRLRDIRLFFHCSSSNLTPEPRTAKHAAERRPAGSVPRFSGPRGRDALLVILGVTVRHDGLAARTSVGLPPRELHREVRG